jgi:hypothetical protein
LDFALLVLCALKPLQTAGAHGAPYKSCAEDGDEKKPRQSRGGLGKLLLRMRGPQQGNRS